MNKYVWSSCLIANSAAIVIHLYLYFLAGCYMNLGAAAMGALWVVFALVMGRKK